MAIRAHLVSVFAASEERDLAARLDEAFDITYRGTIGNLAFWLAEAKSHVKERFGLIQELLVIYSPFPRTDARVLTSFDELSSRPEYRSRIDRFIGILIHFGAVDQTATLLASQTDRVIVPFTAAELRNVGHGDLFIRSRLAERIGAIDLFGISSPITTDRNFFGRDDIVQTLIGRNINGSGNSGLFGLRKTGKTSVLFAIERRLEGQPILVSYVDCQNPGIHAARWWQVLEQIASRLASDLKKRHKRDTILSTPYSWETAGSQFLTDIRTMMTRGQLDRILIMLDEIEYITPQLSGALGRHWDRDAIPFWQTVRAVHQELRGAFSFIVAGVNGACVERSHIGDAPNPIFQLAVPEYLKPLSVDAVKEMIKTIGRYAGIRPLPDLYSYLQSTYGGHPYLIRIACSEVWRSKGTVDPHQAVLIGVPDCEARREVIRHRLSQPLRDILLSLVWWYRDEYDLLHILATGDADFVRTYIADRPDAVVPFERYGLLKPGAGEFAIVDLRDFLNRFGDEYKAGISPFSRSDMPPELLPEVPDLAALGELFALRTEIETAMRRAILLYLGVKANWNPTQIAKHMARVLQKRQDRPDPAEMFVGREPQDVVNELFTLDLKDIVLGNWDVFAPLFDGQKQRFEMVMDSINRARRSEGHTKPVTGEEVTEFKNSYLWLRARLAKLPQHTTGT